MIPRRSGRTSGARAEFLVDKSEYVLGVDPDGTQSEAKLQERLGLFRDSIANAYQATRLDAVGAIQGFLGSEEQRQRAVDALKVDGYKSNDLFAFECAGRLVHELTEVQQYYSTLRRSGAEGGAQCLACGRQATPVKKHPSVKVPGGSTSGVALVSFNSDAFESYGLERNENAPVCRDCADAYTTALNRLFSDRYPDPQHPGETLPRRAVRLSPDTTAVYWTDQYAPVTNLFADLFDSPGVEAVGALFASPYQGREAASASGRFYCLILSGGQGRATVRSSHFSTVGEVENHLRDYFESMDIGAGKPLPLLQALRGLVLQGKLENLPPGLVTEIFLSIVFGDRYPLTLLTSAVGRCRAERRVSRERAALLRSYFRRNHKEISVGLDRENVNSGYRLGRLLAILERLQSAAQNNPNKTIVDRYYGAASTRPGTVFPRLIAMSNHHAEKLTTGLRLFYRRAVGEVIDGISVLPTFLNMEDQGFFALGYYHQRQEFFKKAEDTETEKGEIS